MARFAERTKVPVGATIGAIENVLTKYGANGFLYGHDETRAMIGFTKNRRQIRFLLPLDGLDEQQTRQRWRALLMVIKSKLESVECGIEEFDEAFLANIVLPDGNMVGSWLRPQIETAYENGDMPKLLPAPEKKETKHEG